MKLEGIKVVDLSLFLPGPAMTQVMADHGAEVI
ncbi:MAG: CoA transferase, partial [Geminicoccaceae bacterium]